MLHAAYVCHGSFACSTRDNLVAGSHILSSRDTPPMLHRRCASDSLTVQLFLYINVLGGCWMLQHLFRPFVRSWNVFCLHLEDWGGSLWDEGFESQFCLYSAHSSFFSPALINYFLMCWFLPEKHWEFLRFWQRGLWKRLKSWIRECLSEKDLIDKVSAI